MRRFFSSSAALNSGRVCSVWSIPINLGQPLLGPDKAPSLLQKAGLNNILKQCDWRVDIQPPFEAAPVSHTVHDFPSAKNIDQIGRTCKTICDTMTNYIAQNEDNFHLILGGDHCIPIGTIPALVSRRPNTGVIWVDAHADVNTPPLSSSGNVHGMPVAFLLGLIENCQKLPSFDWYKPCLKPEDIVYIGLRDVDEPEKETIRKLGIKAFSMHDIDRYGIGMVMEKTLQYLAHKDHIHVSYDIDALDPFYAPATGTAVRGGLTFREGNFVCEMAYSTGKLSSFELVEVNPTVNTQLFIGASNDTVEMAMTLIASAMGKQLL